MVHLQPFEGAVDEGDRALTFPFEGHQVRVMERGGEPWWVLSDICDALSIGSPHKAAVRLDEDEKGRTTVPTLGGNQEMAIINQSGLYSLVLTSRKEEAKRFKKWVTAEVLPAIRKTGGYMVAAPAETPEQIMARALLLAQDTVDRQKAQLAAAQPKATAFDQIASGDYLPSINKFFRAFEGVNLIAVNSRLIELGYLYRDAQGNCRVRRERPHALEMFREHISQNTGWTAVTISLRAAGQVEMSKLYHQGQIPMLKGFYKRLQ